MEEISFEEFNSLTKDSDSNVLIKIDTVPLRMKTDYITRNYNVKKNRELCTRCNGTGNEFYLMFCKCKKCEGMGY